MKTIFTYPNDLATDYIDPLYLGNATSGFYIRANELKLGDYKAWGSGIAPTQDINLTIQNMSKYHNAFLEDSGNSTIYKFWEQPLIQGNIELISATILNADTATPINFTFTNDHGFAQDEEVVATEFDSTLDVINNRNFYVKKISDTVMQLSTNSALTELLEYVIVANDQVTSATAANPVVFTSVGYGSYPGAVRLSAFDGTMSLYNGLDFYMTTIDADTFNLTWDAAGTDVLGMTSAITTGIDIVSWDFPSTTVTPVPSIWDPWYQPQMSSGEWVGYPSWSTNPKINLAAGTAPQLSGDSIHFAAVTPAYLTTTASLNPTSLNDYKIMGMSNDGNRIVYQSDTSTDQLMDWTGTEFEINSWFPSGAVTLGTLKALSPDGGFILYSYPAAAPSTELYLYADSLKQGDNTSTLGGAMVRGNINPPGDGSNPPATGTPFIVSDNEKITYAWADGLRLGFSDWDHDGTDTSEGRIFMADAYSQSLSNVSVSPKAIITNPYSGSNTDAQFGLSIQVQTDINQDPTPILGDGKPYISISPGLMFATNHAANNGFGTNTRHEIYTIPWTYNGTNYTPTHEGTILQNSGATNIITSSYVLGTTTHVVDPKLSYDGLTYVIAGQGGIHVYKEVSGTWTLVHELVTTNDVVNIEIFTDGETIKAQTAVGIETWELSGGSWAQTAATTIADMGYMTGANGGYTFACAREYDGVIANQTEAYAQETSPTSSAIIASHRNTSDQINDYLNGINSNTYYIKNTGVADQYDIFTDPQLTIPFDVRPILNTTFIPAQTTDTTSLIYTTAPTVQIGNGTTKVPSTTGEILDVHGYNPWQVPTGAPQVVTNGKLTIDPTMPLPYHFSGTTLFLPGNLTYQQRTGESTYVNGAIIGDNVWLPGATSASAKDTYIPALTVNQDASGYITSVTEVDPGTTGDRWSSPFVFMLTIDTAADTYTPPVLTPAEEEDVFDTEDQWASDGFTSPNKKWPDHVTPMSAEINYSSPTIANLSQSGIKYTRSAGHTKWQLDVVYPPMTAADFKIFHAIAQAAHGQSTPFYFNLNAKDGGKILWKDFYDQTNTTVTPRFKDPIVSGDTLALFEGFSGNEANAFMQGEVFIDGVNENGNLHTALSGTAANVYGEAKIRTPWPFRSAQSAGQTVYKDPYHAVVTLADDNFTWSVDVNNYYYVSVSFDLDSWK
tara:strand:+ start:2089 stop:5631 length:3543 start_codon:yes stop_codon:yes gene_type:complete